MVTVKSQQIERPNLSKKQRELYLQRLDSMLSQTQEMRQSLLDIPADQLTDDEIDASEADVFSASDNLSAASHLDMDNLDYKGRMALYEKYCRYLFAGPVKQKQYPAEFYLFLDGIKRLHRHHYGILTSRELPALYHYYQVITAANSLKTEASKLAGKIKELFVKIQDARKTYKLKLDDGEMDAAKEAMSGVPDFRKQILSLQEKLSALPQKVKTLYERDRIDISAYQEAAEDAAKIAEQLANRSAYICNLPKRIADHIGLTFEQTQAFVDSVAPEGGMQ